VSIIVSRRGEPAKRLDRTVIQREEYLQSYIHDNPHALPLEELREDLRLSVLAREFPTESGPIDVLAVDDHGEVYLIETKLYKNPDKRQVLAQILDYGAALWSSAEDPDALLLRLEDLCDRQAKMSLREKLAADLLLDPDDVIDLLSNVRNRFEEGTYRFVVLMDRIHDRLKTLLRFVNENSRFDIFGVELDFYQDGDLEILMPRLYGAEVRKQVPKSGGGRRKWDEALFFAEVEQNLAAEHVAAIRTVVDWAQAVADKIIWGTGAVRGSFNPRFHVVSTRSLFTVWSDGQLSTNYGWLRDEDAGALYIDRMAAELAKVAALRPLAETKQDFPALPVTEWAPAASEFIGAVERTLERSLV
jgi:hypothetical protein